jgi:uncharacterized protein DUF2252
VQPVRRPGRLLHRLGLAAVCLAVIARPSAHGQLRPDPPLLAEAPASLLEQLRADPFNYFRFVNRPWTARVCQAFADVHDMPIVRLHGDAHIEQYAFTRDARGLDDFDDSARGPEFVDLIRFMGSIDLATRQRGWTAARAALMTRFLDGYRRGLAAADYRPPEPDIVRQLRAKTPVTRPAFLAWGESLMRPMDETTSQRVVDGMAAFERFMRGARPDLPASFFSVVRAGWIRIGVGSALTRKVLVRVRGRTSDPADDELLEVKEATNLEGLSCLEGRTTPPALRIIEGARQLGRLKHEILAIGPTLLIPRAADRAEHWLDWWVRSWEPSYREVRLSDLRTVRDLDAIVFDSGAQLGAGEPPDAAVRGEALASVARLDGRLRKESSAMVEALLAGWREIGGR